MFFVPLGQKKDDARLTITQIILLQSSHYFLLGCSLLFLGLLLRVPPSIELYFSYRAFNIFNRHGIVTCLSWLFTSFLSAVMCLLIVQRAVKCLDHVVTLYVTHFLACLLYRGFPLYWEWWITMLIGFGVTALLGEYICYQVESRDIPLLPTTVSSSSNLSSTTVPSPNNNNNSTRNTSRRTPSTAQLNALSSSSSNRVFEDEDYEEENNSNRNHNNSSGSSGGSSIGVGGEMDDRAGSKVEMQDQHNNNNRQKVMMTTTTGASSEQQQQQVVS